eukprot:5897857-Prymnesium_polylepis.1
MPNARSSSALKSVRPRPSAAASASLVSRRPLAGFSAPTHCHRRPYVSGPRGGERRSSAVCFATMSSTSGGGRSHRDWPVFVWK